MLLFAASTNVSYCIFT